MLKPTKKSFKPKEKVNFKLEFHVTLVPQRGWDKLLVSLISVETSKVTAKTGKVPVRNGACQWSEPVYESAFLSQESNGKDADKELYKLVVSMGLSRFGILGEATINLADYVQALAPVSLSLPLQNCNFGSILHVKIQCIKPKSASRDFEEHKEIFLEQVSQPAMFEGGQQTELESCQKTNTENSDKDDSVPLSTPRYSSDSVDVPSTPEVSESHLYSREGMGEELMSPSSSTSSCSGRQESGNTFNDCVRFSRTDQGFTNDFTSPEANAKLSFSTYYSKKSHNGNNNQNDQFSPSESSVWSNDKTKELEAAEVTIKELRLEAVSWQQQGKQLGMQMEALKQQFVEEKKRSDELQRTLFVLREEKKRSDELQRTLLALGEERNSIKQEMKKSKSMEDSHVKAGEGLDWRELQDELEYEKSMNANLILQLRKTLESNSELLLEIQDLERLLQENNQLEKQPNQPSELGIRDLESTEEDSRKTVGALKKELEELERDSQELTEENMDLISQLKQANDKLKAKEATILQLEMKITNEISTQAKSEAGKFRDMVNEMEDKLRDCEESYESKLASSRTLIDDLNSSVVMVRSKNTCLERELQSSEERTSELLKEVESLKMENDGHEREKALIASQKGQLKGLREKAGKAEQENINAAKRVKELEAMNRELKEEKNGVFAALKKQLEDSQEHALATDAKYKEVLQVMAHMRAEKLDFEKEMPMLLKAKEAAEVTVAQLQSFNAVLQEKLQLEQLKTSELLQQCEDSEAKSSQLLEEMKVNQTEIKSLKQAATKVETVVKEMESKVHDLQEENSLCRSQIKELELHKAASEEEMLSLQASRSAFEARSQDLQVVNDELSEKLKNAREDIEWARENTNTLVNEIRELESEIESDVLVRNELKQSVSELEAHNENLQIQVRKLSDKILQLEKEVMDFEGQYKDAMNEKGALVVVIREQESAHKVTEASLQAVIKQQQDKIQQLASDGGNKEKQLLLEVSVLRTEKTGVEEKLRKSQDMLNQAKRDTSNLKEKLELQVYEATVKELDMMKKLDDTVREAQFLRDEKLYCSQRMMELEAKCAVVELEKDSMSAQMSELRSRTEKCELWQREKEEAEKALPILKQEKEKLEALLEHAVQEMATLKESLKSLEDAASQWKQSKAAMEEKISHLQEANAKGSRRPLEEKNSELSKLRKQTSELKHKLSEQELEREELKKRIFSLEEELQLKASALALVEKKLKDRETSAYGGSPVSLFARSLSRANSRVGPMSSIPPTRREAKALADLRERVKLLEGEVKRKEAELAASKQQLKEQHTQLSIKIEHLELANEQLMKENSNSNVDQILKEEKKELEHALLKFKAAANGENFLNRIATLEMELAEALEANNMYKMQLQSAFSKQHNVHVAALENLGSVEQVIQDLADLKRKNLILEDELRNIRERYFNMSLQFAEVEAEREELVMTIRTLQGGKKLKPYRSVNF